MSELAIFSRCYAHLTGFPLPLKDERITQIKANKLRGVEACLNLLEATQLSTDGQLATKQVEAKRMLNNFYEFHRTWFPTHSAEQILGYQNEFDGNVKNTMEFSSPALTLTQALFADKKYSTVLAGDDQLYAIRGDSERGALDSTSTFEKVAVADASNRANEERTFDAPFVAKHNGFLLGIKNFKINTSIDVFNVAGAFPDLAQVVLPSMVFKSFGGGILGQQSFFALNNGHIAGQVFDGALKLPRKWAKVSLESMMCLQLPALRLSDVEALVDINSEVPFRKASSCVSCHASMDQFASVARNWVVAKTSPFNKQKTIFVAEFKGELMPIDHWSSRPVEKFNLQQPTGKLLYRSYASGTLVDESVKNVEELGQKMAQQEEFYQCAAKRYFQYFTGIKVSLYDRTDSANEELNKALTVRDIADRLFVESLATDLRRTQSLRRLIEQIIRSPYYKSDIYSLKEEQ